MRPEHTPHGDPCSKCGLAAFRHRARKRDRKEYDKGRARSGERVAPAKPRENLLLGIDGEGQGREPHKYIYLAASTSDGRSWETENKKGLSTYECLKFFVKLPKPSKCFAFASGYDLTMILKDLSNTKLYFLIHPEYRKIPDELYGRRTWIQYKCFELDYFNGAFSVRLKGSRQSTKLWDIFRFFGTKFTESLKSWGVGTAEELELLQRMKSKRAEFDKEDFQGVKDYCKLECKRLAELAERLIKAHDDADLSLTSFYGAGSTATALLKKLEIEKYIEGASAEDSPELKDAVAHAFFGGRFENSVTGAIEGTVFNYDISSAYPYQTTFLPCLRHGRWTFVPEGRSLLRRIEKARLACVQYETAPDGNRQKLAWGPLPFRTDDGCVLFPVNARGWVWKPEFLEAIKYWDIKAKGAWCYGTSCHCRPFKEVPNYYLERIRIGKEGKGIVIKLGCNSIYGKTAQSKGGGGRFTNWVWAGNITSGTRAQLLEIFGLVKDPRSVLMFATDGIQTTERVFWPKPRDTGTFGVEKPLGGWEEKVYREGVFYIRPGIYCPLAPTPETLKDVRARGIGKASLYDSWQKIVDAHNAWDRRDFGEVCEVGNITRFIGMKTAVYEVKAQKLYRRRPNYGQWEPWPIKVSFNPLPKRERVLRGDKLLVRDAGGEMSSPYLPALGQEGPLSDDDLALKFFEMMMLEQPDIDACEYNLED